MREVNCTLCLLSFFAIFLSSDASSGCSGSNFKYAKGRDVDDYIVYGITQDCQLFFVRSSQFDLLSSIKVVTKNSYCYPNIVQLHIVSHTTLLLLIKQAGNRICTLELNIPPPQILFGERIFSYSLITSLPYAACSHTPVNSFSLETDLSFMDSAYKDVIYFVDSKSEGSYWTVRQFLIDEKGTLKLMDKMEVDSHVGVLTKDRDVASEFVVHLDAQKNFLFKMNRLHRNYMYECAFDLVFRPHLVKSHSGNVTNPFAGASWLNSIGVDGKMMLISETSRAGTLSTTFVHAVNISHPHTIPHCIAKFDFAADIGVIRISSLDKMRDFPLPKFDPNKKMDLSGHFTSSVKPPLHSNTSNSIDATSTTTILPSTRKHAKSKSSKSTIRSKYSKPSAFTNTFAATTGVPPQVTTDKIVTLSTDPEGRLSNSIDAVNPMINNYPSDREAGDMEGPLSTPNSVASTVRDEFPLQINQNSTALEFEGGNSTKSSNYHSYAIGISFVMAIIVV